jgi:hypothetical protein
MQMPQFIPHDAMSSGVNFPCCILLPKLKTVS